MDVRGRIGHRGRSYSEGIAGTVRGSEAIHRTVVACRRLRPRHRSRADSCIAGLGDVGRGAGNGRILVVRHSHIEAGRGRVTGSIHSRVGHRRRAHGERGTRTVRAREGRHGAVVSRCRLRPGHSSTAIAGIRGLRDVPRRAGNARRFSVKHRHRECGGCVVAARVGRREGHCRRTDREG